MNYSQMQGSLTTVATISHLRDSVPKTPSGLLTCAAFEENHQIIDEKTDLKALYQGFHKIDEPKLQLKTVRVMYLKP